MKKLENFRFLPKILYRFRCDSSRTECRKFLRTLPVCRFPYGDRSRGPKAVILPVQSVTYCHWPSKKARIVAIATKPSIYRANPAKAAPSIPRVVLQEPKLVCQKAFCFPEQSVEFCLCAGNGYLQRTAVIQGKHTHEAAAVDMVVVTADGEGKGLHGCPGNKVLYIPARQKAHIELAHFYPP